MSSNIDEVNMEVPNSAEEVPPVPIEQSSAIPQAPAPSVGESAPSLPSEPSESVGVQIQEVSAPAQSTMEAIVQTFVGSSNPLDKLIVKMNQLATEEKWGDISLLVRSSEENMIKRCGDLEQFILNCDPSKHTAAIIMAICLIFDIAEKKKIIQTQERSIEILKHFLDQRAFVKQQVMTVIDLYSNFFRRLHDFCVTVKKEPHVAIPIVEAGLSLIVEKGSGEISSLHAHLFSLALKSEQPAAVYEYIEDTVKGLVNEMMVVSNSMVNPSNQPYLDPKFMLQYLYYGAEICLHCGDIRRAAALLLDAIVFPAHTTHNLHMAAYKKWIVVQLILDGDVTPPASRSACTVRTWKEQGELYGKLTTAIRLTDGDKAKAIETVLNENLKTFTLDRNVDLIVRLVECLKERALLKMAKCFSTIRLADLTRRAFLEDDKNTVSLCEKLHNEGRLLVRFENDIAYLELPRKEIDIKRVVQVIDKMTSMQKELERVHNEVLKSPYFLSKTMKPSPIGQLYPDDEGLSIPPMALFSRE